LRCCQHGILVHAQNSPPQLGVGSGNTGKVAVSTTGIGQVICVHLLHESECEQVGKVAGDRQCLVVLLGCQLQYLRPCGAPRALYQRECVGIGVIIGRDDGGGIREQIRACCARSTLLRAGNRMARYKSRWYAAQPVCQIREDWIFDATYVEYDPGMVCQPGNLLGNLV
jgi:hypothetical protein